MKKFLIGAFCLLNLTSFAQAETCDVEVHFSPTEQMTPIIQDVLNSAKTSVQVSLFGLTNDQLADTLIKLHQAGILVEVGVDKKQSKVMGSDIEKLKAAGIPVYVKKTGILEHNKYAIIDSGTVIILGSWNWSAGAQFQDNSDVILKNCLQSAKKINDDFSRIKQRDQ